MLSKCLVKALFGLMAVAGVTLQAPCAWAGTSKEPPLQQIRAFRTAHARDILQEFVQFLAIPNVASDRPNIRRNADAIAKMLERRGLKPELLQLAGTPDVPPLVYAQWRVPGAKRTLVLYAHYDGQPVNAAEWATGPWAPTLRDAPLSEGGSIIHLDSPQAVEPQVRVYARGAGDDKAGVMVILGAIDALRSAKRHPTDNVKIVFEGEEEAGSPHLRQLLSEHRALFDSQLWVICDGPVSSSGRVQVTYGARGDVNVDLTLYGAKRPLHSGHYGNWAPNPALRLARLLASMKDEKGHVVIAGWYDGIAPLGQTERRALADAAEDDASLRRELGIAAAESDWSFPESATVPSLNINGMRSANVGAEAANVIPDTATAVLDLRLVLGNDPDQQVEKLRAHVRSQGYYLIDHTPTPEELLTHPLVATLTVRPGVYAAARMPMDEPFARGIVAAARTATARPILELPTAGGSLPLSIIKESLGTAAMVVSIANYDDYQHAANENLRLGSLWDGIDVFGALLVH